MSAILGYAGTLSTVEGHKLARIRAKARAARWDAKAEAQADRAAKDLARFLARWGNGTAEPPGTP